MTGTIGALALGTGLVRPSLAVQDEDGEVTEEDDDGEEVAEEDDEFEDDIDLLNFLLTLERLEAQFYRRGLDTISEEELVEYERFEDDTHLQEVAYDELATIQEHEERHEEVLTEAIEEHGGEPVEEPEFDFGTAVEDPGVFLNTAVQIEEISVSAYAGAAPSIEDEELLETALRIHSVEGRHASFMWVLTTETGFPDALDESRSRSEVEEFASGFLVDDSLNGESPDDEEE